MKMLNYLYPEVRLLGQRVVPLLISWGTSIPFSTRNPTSPNPKKQGIEPWLPGSEGRRKWADAILWV